ncbi:hypothetical protein P8452_36124 [Trifolium repens]|nr:hypothetical protein P8452_36124 [Trifolium repens]
MKIGFLSNTDRVFGFRLRPRNLDDNYFYTCLNRCSDANLVEIPIQILWCLLITLFFQVVNNLATINTDNGIDFDDHDQPVKLFQCKCCSKFSRNMKRSNISFSQNDHYSLSFPHSKFQP